MPTTPLRSQSRPPQRPSRLLALPLDEGAAELLITEQPDLNFAPHWHESWSVGAIAQGVCRFACEGRAYEAHAGDVIVMRPFAVHTASVSPKRFEMVMAYLPTAWVGRLMGWPAGQLPAGVAVVRHDAALAQALAEAARGLQADALREAAAQALQQALDQTTGFSPAAPMPARVQALCEALQSDEAAAADLAALAQRSGLSREHLHRLFRKTIGLTPQEYARLARMARAKRLLLQGAALSDAAHDCGFADQAHFSRWFKRYFGVTPAAYGAG
jgi:AraC-like DNA-binding protein/quercetin dioxygenase-like cupin family protein